MLRLQLLGFNARLTEVPQGNLDATADRTEYEAHQGCVAPVDVPTEDRQARIERAFHVGLKRSAKVISAGGYVQVQKSWSKNNADYCLPGDRDGGIEATDEWTIVSVCRHGARLSLLGIGIVKP